MQGLGQHILAELYGCDGGRLNNLELLGRASLDAVERSGATIMSHHFKSFEPQGVSGVIVIAESHLSFHTWPEHGYAAVDYFTCGDRIDLHLAVDLLGEAMQASRTERKLHWRGSELAGEPHRPDVQQGDRAPQGPRISDQAANVERWITEYRKDRHTGRRQVGYSYLAEEDVVREVGPLQEVTIVQNPVYGRMLFIDGHLRTTERDGFVYPEMLAHVPLNLHPLPRRVLIIGGGDGGLLGEVLRHDTVEQVDLVEVDEQVLDINRRHRPDRGVGLDDERVRVHIQDPALFADQAEPASYDVALVDSTAPVGPARELFRAPFFRALQRVLTPEGLLATQSLSPWVQAEEQRELYGELGAVWPQVSAYHATVPTYPGGLRTFACCGNHPLDVADFNRERAARVSQRCRYFTSELQTAAFGLPRFVRQNTVEIAQARRRRADSANRDVISELTPDLVAKLPADKARSRAR